MRRGIVHAALLRGIAFAAWGARARFVRGAAPARERGLAMDHGGRLGRGRVETVAAERLVRPVPAEFLRALGEAPPTPVHPRRHTEEAEERRRHEKAAIEPETPPLDIEEVVAQLLARGAVVIAVDLRQPGEPRPDDMAQRVTGQRRDVP